AAIGTGVAIWSAATLLTGFTTNFLQLFMTRAILGIGEASYYPGSTSLLADFFPQAIRGRAMSIWSAGSVFGIAVGFAGGGLLAAHFGWRQAFFACAAPGLVLAVLAFGLREPPRGSAEPDGPLLRRTDEASPRRMLGLLRIKTLRDTTLSQTALFFVLAANAYWLPTLLTRRFGMNVGEAGTLAGVVIVIGGLLGTLLGGWVADWRRKRSPRADLEVAIVGFVAAAVLITLAMVGPEAWFVPLFLLTVTSLYLYTGPFTAVGQNVVVPSLRGSAVSVTLLIAHLFGDSYASAAVGFLSDAIGSLQLALLLVSPALLLVAAGLAAMALGSIESDTLAMHRDWRQRSLDAPTPAPALR
ncbi:MAG: MFS transporter, partial [Chloroflexi bacterium]|nr:MFS transporter [Chloroflexota bacterium]